MLIDLALDQAVVRWYLQKVQAIARAAGKTAVVWQEAFDHYGDSAYPPATDAPKELGMDTLVLPSLPHPFYFHTHTNNNNNNSTHVHRAPHTHGD